MIDWAIVIPLILIIFSLMFLFRNFKVHKYRVLILDEMKDLIFQSEDFKDGKKKLEIYRKSKITYNYMLFNLFAPIKKHYQNLRKEIGLIQLEDFEVKK